MNNPQLIILDEPAAGLNDTETAELTKLIRKIQDKYNEIINSEQLDRILDEGREKTRKIAKAKLDLMKEKVGLIR